jgi:hypothetical protein
MVTMKNIFQKESNGSKFHQYSCREKFMELKNKLLTGLLAASLTIGAAKAANDFSKYPLIPENKQTQQVDFSNNLEKKFEFSNVANKKTNNRNVSVWEGYIKVSADSIPGAGSFVAASNTLDTLLGSAGSVTGYYNFVSANLHPQPQNGDTINIWAFKDTLNKRYETKFWFEFEDGIMYPVPVMCLNDTAKPVGYTLNVRRFVDTLPLTQSLIPYAESYLPKNPGQKDTSLVDPPSCNYDHFWHTQGQDSTINQGDTINTRFYKTRNDSAWWSDTFAIAGENTFANVILMADTIRFPQNTPVRDFALEEIVRPQGTLDSGTVVIPKILVNNYGIISDQWFPG